MINSIPLFVHPGLILILTGIISAIVPRKIAGIVNVIGPAIALVFMLILKAGDVCTLSFINDMTLFVIVVDRLNYVFGMIFSMMALIGAIYSMHNKSRLEEAASMLYAGGALGVTLAGDWMTLIFFWELMAAASLFLIWANKSEASVKAGFRYLLVHMLGGNLLLLGIILKVSAGDIMVSNVSEAQDAAFWLILIGVAVNAAIPPIHGWLVDAYPEGTVTGSVFLSSFTTKVAVYCLIRIFAGTEFLVWAGVVMALYGALFALIENDMRRLLSYHIVSQVGFMVCGVGIGTALALDGATAHAFSHILYKSLLFMCAGAIIRATGIRKINQLGGMAKKMPVVFICFTVAAFSIAGVPFFNGFISKSITITAACEAGYPMAELLLQLASVGTFLSIVMKMGYFIFFGEEADVTMRPVPKNMYVAMIIGATLCVIYGVFPHALYEFLPYEFEYHPFTLDHLVQYVQLLGVSIVPFVMYIEHMQPHSALSLDTDWLYRKPFARIVKDFSSLCVTTQLGLGEFFKNIYNDTRKFMKSPFGTGAYNPDIVREPAGNTMVTILITLICAIIFIILMPGQIM
ncbi:MAG: Na(+)/H(+) antiporter subunit D [Clostridiales bacterium]|nr:Na(+)/H(+) antiporter subunit D [Clostridiales bacterium]